MKDIDNFSQQQKQKCILMQIKALELQKSGVLVEQYRTGAVIDWHAYYTRSVWREQMNKCKYCLIGAGTAHSSV